MEMKNMTGQRCGHWTVIEFHHVNNKSQAYWLCQCDCGAIKPVRGDNLRSGVSTKCINCAAKLRQRKK